jgi:hypothetical protein
VIFSKPEQKANDKRINWFSLNFQCNMY